jgi:hypothetical protein
MGSYVFAFSNWDSINSQPDSDDIVSLLNLPRAISEYTDEHIGEIIPIPYNDESGNIEGPIEFEVVGVNHHKDVNDETKPTITLMTKKVIRYVPFDAKEPDNPFYDEEWDGTSRAKNGNNCWSMSNIRQWLNSEGLGSYWFTSQHEYDVAPDTTNVHTAEEAYADDPGFLAGFSNEIKQHFATVRNKTILCDADRLALSKDFEETEDIVFLPSYTEMGFGNMDNNNPEGIHLDKRFPDDESRIKNDIDDFWERRYWLRSCDPHYACDTYYVDFDGTNYHYSSYGSGVRYRPAYSSLLMFFKHYIYFTTNFVHQ